MPIGVHKVIKTCTDVLVLTKPDTGSLHTLGYHWWTP